MNHLTILLIDDEVLTLKTMQGLLWKHFGDIDTLTAENGERGVELAKKHLPDLVITDWHMPQKDGMYVVKELQADPATHEIPIIVVSGMMVSDTNLKEALELGAVDFIRKPVAELELIARMNSSLSLSKSYQDIKALNESKEWLFSVIAQDLSSPIDAIGHLLELKEETSVSPQKIQSIIKDIRTEMYDASNILNNLFVWAKYQMGSIQASLQSISIEVIFRPVIDLLRPTLEAKGITFDLELPTDGNVYADREMVALVFRNFLVNAIKSTEAGGIISVKTLADDDYLRVEIQDNGTGMAQEKVDLLLTGNQHVLASMSDEKGLVLGLLLCKEFMKNNKGEVGGTSEWRKGSTFWFSLISMPE